MRFRLTGANSLPPPGFEPFTNIRKRRNDSRVLGTLCSWELFTASGLVIKSKSESTVEAALEQEATREACIISYHIRNRGESPQVDADCASHVIYNHPTSQLHYEQNERNMKEYARICARSLFLQHQSVIRMIAVLIIAIKCSIMLHESVQAESCLVGLDQKFAGPEALWRV